MRKLITLATVVTLVATPTAGVAANSATAPTATTKITCRWTEYNPTPTNLSGFVLGLITCSQPLGRGVLSATYSATFNPTTGAGRATGKWTKWLLHGTINGRYSETFQFTTNNAATYSETDTWTGGTGAFADLRGTGTISCNTTDAGATLTCQSVAKVTGL